MPEVSKKQPTIFSFQDDPPQIAYLDPSFLLNVLVAESTVEGLKMYTCNPKVL